MSRLELELADGKTRFHPGETVEGVAFWDLDGPPTSVEVRLFWRTRGRGIVDVEVIESFPEKSNGARDRRPFRFVLPSGPYSVSGSLVSIGWGIEVVAEPSGDSASVDITVSPTGEEIQLLRVVAKA